MSVTPTSDDTNSLIWLRTMLATSLVKIAEAELPDAVIELLEDKKPPPRDCAQIGYGAAVMGFHRMIMTILKDEAGKP